MKIFLDDCRNPHAGWTLVRTTEEAIALLELGNVAAISLDHDLGHLDTKTGYDVACWIEERVFTQDFQPPKLFCHSQNPVGRKRILAVFDRIQKFLDEGQHDGQAMEKGQFSK